MPEFSDWEFLLNGDTQEFRQLSNQPGTGYFNIYGGIDHWLDCPNDDFRMTSYYCEGESDPRVIWQIGHELVSLFNGASLLTSKDYRKASIYKLSQNGQFLDYVPFSGQPALLRKPSGFTQTQIDENFKNGSKSTIKYPLLHLATENKDVYFILKYLDMPSSWTNYYKLMEAVESFAHEKNINLETVASVRRAFTNTANNFSLSGFDSRHGFKEVTKQNNTHVMSIDEGYDFVTKMIKIYITKVYGI